MTKFNVGDIVYIKDKIVMRYKKYAEQEGATTLVPGQGSLVQVGLAKDIPFTIIHIRYGHYYLTNFNDNWGWAYYQTPLWKGQKYKAWGLSPDILEKRDLNTVSLHELNRGL